jgi:hypothetical protein
MFQGINAGRFLSLAVIFQEICHCIAEPLVVGSSHLVLDILARRERLVSWKIEGGHISEKFSEKNICSRLGWDSHITIS